MKTLYYIGGPWDLIKRAIPVDPVSRITVRAFDGMSGLDANVADGSYSDHQYMVRRVGRDTFIAVHERVSE